MICLLEVRTFNAAHFYGSLCLYDGDERQSDSHALTYRLGILQARAMNKAHGITESDKTFLWEAGAKCNAFFSEQDVIDMAKKSWRDAFPGAEKLVRGTRHLAGYDLLAELEKR